MANTVYAQAKVRQQLVKSKKYERLDSWFSDFGDISDVEVFDVTDKRVYLRYKGLTLQAEESWALDHKGYMTIWHLYQDGETKHGPLFRDGIDVSEKVVALLAELEKVVEEQP